MSTSDEEQQRQAALDALHVDPFEDAAYDDITRLAAETFKTPVALISIVDGDRQWFKSKVGLQATQTPREVAFCNVTIRDPDGFLVVEDARQDARFRDNPLVTGDPLIRFYAGAPLKTSTGHAIGTLCVIDVEPHSATAAQLDTLRFLAQQVILKIEQRRAAEGTEPAPG